MKPGIYQITLNDQTLLQHCEYERSLWFRFCGLMLTPELRAGHGILLKPCNSVHMFFMRYALDIIFLDKDMRILRICHNLKPWHISPIVWKADSVLECPAGLAEQHGLDIGDELELRQLNLNS